MTISHINPNQLRPSDDDSQDQTGELGPIVQIGPDRQAEAITRLLATPRGADREHARRFIQYAHDHRIALDGLWSRLDAQGRVEATVLTVAHPGRTAMVFASHPRDRAQIRSLAGVIDHAVRQLPAINVNLAQSLLEPSETVEREVLLEAGFQDLAMLSYLERPLRVSRGRSIDIQWPAGITAEKYVPTQREDLVDVLHRSYEDTLDCPALRGHRSTSDILDGHQASGYFDPDLWTIVRLERVAVGVLLLNPSADHHSIELVYLGLTKEARGQGLGRQLLRYGLNLVRNRSERVMTLAVDEANEPAMNLYRQEGFKPALRRRALIRPVA